MQEDPPEKDSGGSSREPRGGLSKVADGSLRGIDDELQGLVA